MSSLSQSIYKTLAFFDAQDLPLTLMEVRIYLAPVAGEGQLNLSEIEKTLREELTDKIHHTSGFYFLAGRGELVSLRQQRYQISLRRFRKAKKYLGVLRLIPYLRAAAISGSQALLNSDHKSDIDLLIITAKNRIWLTRLLVSAYFQITGQRRHGKRIQNRFCLNHYLDEEATITADQNFYTAVEYASLIPVMGHEYFASFWQKNKWIENYLHRRVSEQGNTFFPGKKSRAQKVFEGMLDFTFGPALNYLAGKYQKRRIRMQEYILVSDKELSFHPGSRGQTVLGRFQENLQKI